MHTKATAEQLTPTATLGAFRAFIMQRPGLDPANYDRAGYASDSRRIAKDKRRALAALDVAEAYPFAAAAMLNAFNAFSGRLEPVIREDGSLALKYCTGQYWPTEYRAAAAAVLEAYTEAVRPKRTPSPNAQFFSVSDLAAANRAAGGHWFDPESKRFFRSRIAPGLYKGQRLIWFVSSEKSGWEDSSPRKFTVRVFDPTAAGVDSVGELFAHRDLSSARAAARSLAKRDLAGEHIKPAAQGEQCGFCGHYGEGCTGTERGFSWEKVSHAKAEAAGYQVWVDRGLWTVYQVTKLDAPAPTNGSGYRTLDALLSLKNIEA